MSGLIKIFISNKTAAFDSFEDRLPDDRRQTIKNINSAAIRDEKTTASILADYAFRQIGLVNNEDRIIISKQNKKPFLKNGEAYFSISHSHGICACAVSLDNEVGLDIEHERELTSFLAAKKIFDETEYEKFLTLSSNEKSIRLLKRWTLLESCIKLNGKGMRAMFAHPHPVPPIEIIPNIFTVRDSAGNGQTVWINYFFQNNLHISCAGYQECKIEIILCNPCLE